MASLQRHKKHNEEVEGHQDTEAQQLPRTYCHRLCHPSTTMYHRTKHRLPPLSTHSSLQPPHSKAPLPISFASTTSPSLTQLWRQRRSLPQMHLPPFAFCFLLMGSLMPPCVAICPSNCTCDVDVREYYTCVLTCFQIMYLFSLEYVFIHFLK